MPERVTIREAVESGALEVVLEGADLPHASIRERPAFESGGSVEHEAVYLPGAALPVIQVQQARERDMVIAGAFRVHLHVQDGGTDADHARTMRDRLEEIRYRAKPLRVTWGTQERLCFLHETKFSEESEFQIAYELTFRVLRGVARPQRTPREGVARGAPSTVAEQLGQDVAERQAQWAALQAAAVSQAAVSTVLAGLAAVATGVESARSAAQTLEKASGGPAKVSALAAVLGAAGAAQTALAGLRDALAGLPSGASDLGGELAYAAAKWGTLDTLSAVADQLRAAAQAARERARVGTRLYQVRPGDTLESIARQVLGNAGRAHELGLRADQLTAGRLVRIPGV
jgi:hypothetical protein